MTDDLLSTPLTAHERALVLAGVEWMRAAVEDEIRKKGGRAASPPCVSPQGMGAAWSVAQGEHAACLYFALIVRDIPPPALQPARIGVLGEG